MKKFAALSIVLALIMGLGGCPATPVEVELHVSSTSGGSVTTPGEGTYTYGAGTVVDLVAEAEQGYRFVNWTGDVYNIANVNAASTTIGAEGDSTITANFIALYTLTISSAAGGSVIVPGEGTFTYDAGAVVDLVAEAEEGYLFVEWTGDVDTFTDVSEITAITLNGDCSISASFRAWSTPMIAAGEYHTVGLNSDGTVVAVGHNAHGQCDVRRWTHITQVAAGDWHTVGLKYDGTVVAVGRNDYGQCNVYAWTDIIQVAAGDFHTVGLRSDGSVVAVGRNDDGQCDVHDWTDIAQVAIFAGAWNTVGLRADGTVVVAGDNDRGQCDVDDWTGIVQVAAYGHTVGLNANGTVVVVGLNGYEHYDVSGWTDIIQVAAGAEYTVGLKADGTVVAAGRNDYGQCDLADWSGIIGVAAGAWHTVGLKLDGTVVAVGHNQYGQCDVGHWVLS